MVKPDVDLYIISPSPDVASLADITREVTVEDGVVRVTVSNFTKNSSGPGKPRGLYFGLRGDIDGTIWNLDCWITGAEDRLDPENFGKDWHQRLTKRQHDAILLLKHQLTEQGRYPGFIRSADIYRAVMNDGIQTVEAMEEWKRVHPYY